MVGGVGADAGGSVGFITRATTTAGPGRHGGNHLVVARGKNPRYYYQLSSSAGL